MKVRRKQEETLFLFHGEVVQRVDADGSCSMVEQEQVPALMKKSGKYRILLASPFVNAYLHETIRLRPGELKEFDRNLLPFSRASSKYRRLLAWQISDRKQILLHLHLTPQGGLLLSFLRKGRLKIAWDSIIAELIESQLSLFQQIPEKFHSRQYYLEQELIAWDAGVNAPRFFYRPFWLPEESFAENQRCMKNLLEEETDRKNQYEWIRLSTLDRTSLFCRKEERLSKRTTFTGLKTERFGKFLHPLSISTVLLCFVMIYAGSQYYQKLIWEKRELALLEEVAAVKKKVRSLDFIVEDERQYYKLEALQQVAEQLKMTPQHFLNRVGSLLASGTGWLTGVHVMEKQVDMDLILRNEDEWQQLLEQFRVTFGNTTLLNREEVEIGKEKFKKYRITIRVPVVQEARRENKG